MRSLPGRNRNRYTAAVSNKRIKENLVKVDAEFAERKQYEGHNKVSK